MTYYFLEACNGSNFALPQIPMWKSKSLVSESSTLFGNRVPADTIS